MVEQGFRKAQVRGSSPRPRANFIVRPETAARIYNASTEPCDMDWGPCACGAWHDREAGGEA